MIPDWPTQAACLGAEPTQFDPLDSRHPAAEDIQRAYAAIATYCRRCPVTTECLADALLNSVDGVRGGRLLRHGHGSMQGYSKHKRDHTTPCRACLQAQSAYTMDRRRPIVGAS